MIIFTPYLIFIFFIILIAFISYFGSIIFNDYNIHKVMTLEYNSAVSKAKWKDFKKEFDTIKWERDKKFPESYFTKDNNLNLLHAYMIIFNGNAMLLDLISWIKFRIFVKKNRIKIKTKLLKWNIGRKD